MFKILGGWSLSQLARSPSNYAAAQQSDIKMAKSRKGARKGSTTLEEDGGVKRASRRNKREQPSAEEDNSDDDNTIGNSNAMKKRRAVTPGKDPDAHLP